MLTKIELWLANEMFIEELIEKYGLDYREEISDPDLFGEIEEAEKSLVENVAISAYPDGWKNDNYFAEAAKLYGFIRRPDGVILRG